MVQYYVPILIPTWMYAFMDLMFLNMALIDIKRRNFMMGLLSSAIEIDF